MVSGLLVCLDPVRSSARCASTAFVKPAKASHAATKIQPAHTRMPSRQPRWGWPRGMVGAVALRPLRPGGMVGAVALRPLRPRSAGGFFRQGITRKSIPRTHRWTRRDLSQRDKFHHFRSDLSQRDKFHLGPTDFSQLNNLRFIPDPKTNTDITALVERVALRPFRPRGMVGAVALRPLRRV